MSLDKTWKKLGKNLEMEIITIKRHGTASHDSAEAVSKSNENVRKEKTERQTLGGSPDAEFMKMCAKWDKNPPESWSKYDAGTEAGIKKILDMEIKEIAEGTTTAGKIENCYHAAVALLRYWRILENKK